MQRQKITSLLTLTLMVSLTFNLFGQSNKKLYLSVNFNNCTLCNLSIKAYLSNWDKKVPITFLINKGDLNKSQLKEFSEEELGIKFDDYVVDNKLYNKLNLGLENSKFPVISVSINDSLGLNFQLNELPNYISTIKNIMIEDRVYIEKLPVNRIASLPGRFDLAYENNKIYILSWIKNDRIYGFNLKDNSTDSIYLFNNKKLVRSCLNVLGKSNLNEDDIIEIFKAYPIPIKMFSFRNLQANEYGIGCALDFFYFDPNDSSDVLSTEWGHFYFKKLRNENSIKLDLLSFDSVYKINTSSTSLLPDYQTYTQINDTLLLIGLKQRPENDTIYKVKRTTAVYNINKKTLEKSGIRSYVLENANVFSGNDAVNRPDFTFDYFISDSLFYIRTCPKVSFKGITYDLLSFISGTSWIHKLKHIPNTQLIEGYIIRNGNLHYIIANLNKSNLIKDLDLGKFDYSSNIVVNNNAVFLLNKSRELVKITLQN